MSELEELKKEARYLENEIYGKLITLTKLGSANNFNHKQGGDEDPLLSSEHRFEVTEVEIEGLLSQLTENNNKMMEKAVGFDCNSIVLHTLKRHSDVLQDYSSEFNRVRKNYQTRKERELLLQSARQESSHILDHRIVNRRMDIHLKENQHIKSSTSMVDDQINVAIEARDNLISQRNNIKRLQTRLHDMSNRFPLLNGLIQRINIRKRRDSIIIGAVVAVCTMLLLFYSFH